MNARRIADRVYGEIQLPELAALLSSTPEFARLDDIRQLGGCAFVYPSATHTRREHSLGVCHLSGVVVLHLQKLYPEKVSNDDVLCVQLAGLVHDLGHGPFSHLFEEYVGDGFCHEKMGVELFRLMLQNHPEINVGKCFEGRVAENLNFIELLVKGWSPNDKWPGEEVGRVKSKCFLSEIVHSKTTGIDMDKVDYLARDSLSVFGSSNILSITRIVSAIRIRDTDHRLCFDESIAYELSEIFRLRARLHRQVYQHRAVIVAEGLIKDIMKALDERNLLGLTMKEYTKNPRSFMEFGDSNILRLPYMSDVRFEGSPREAFMALYRRPWLTRIPLTVSLRTLPYCKHCRHTTSITDIFCRFCGQITSDRPFIVNDGGLCVPPECGISSNMVTDHLNERLKSDSVKVYISDINCGTPISVTDANKKKWRDFAPLKEIVFVTRANAYINMRSDSFLIPEIRHVRIAHCYLPVDATEELIEYTTKAFREWGESVGEVAES